MVRCRWPSLVGEDPLNAMIDADKNRTALFRRTILQSDGDFRAETIARLSWRPTFHLLIGVDGDDRTVERFGATLVSLARQAYRDWTLHLIPRYRDLDFGELVVRLRDGQDDVQ